MVDASELEGIILNDERVTSVINTLANSTETQKNPLARAWNFALNSLVFRQTSKERLEQRARKYFDRMRSETNPNIMKITVPLAEFVVTQLFSEVHVQGIERLAAAIEDKKRVKVYSTHFSYYDLGVWPYVFAQQGITNEIYYIGGQNVTRIPLIGKGLSYLFRKSGSIEIDRDLKGKKLLLARAVLQAFVAYLLNHRAIVLDYTGKGRNRHKVEPVRAASSGAAITDADLAFPIAISYFDPPESRDFALEGKRRAGKSLFGSVVHAVTKLLDKGHYGPVYVTIGEPIPTAQYRQRYLAASEDGKGSHIVKEFEDAVTKAITRAVTVTSTGLLAAVLNNQSVKEFTFESITGTIEDAVAGLSHSKANVAEDLGTNIKGALMLAANKLVERGAISVDGAKYTLKGPKLIQFYAEKATPTLKEFGIT